jgi:translation initiation factor IF-2
MTTSSNKNKRPPVVVVMGHVDHGKTTLLDYIRKSNTAAREAGGITQAVGAYTISHDGQAITFIDTPGHEAFSKMRARGATIADIAILVVAADDGVSAQTKEAIKTITDAKLNYIVAINKIDIAGANIEKTKSSLLQAGVLLEGMGGDISFQAVSAKTGEGVSELLELISLTADVNDLTCDTTGPAEGFVLEAHMGSGGGTVTVVIKNGTLRVGDEIATPTAKGRVKGLKDFEGKMAKELTPCSPAVILGFEALPSVGDPFACGSKIASLPKPKAASAVQGGAAVIAGKTKMNLILKAGVAGALEALSDAVKKLKVPDNTNLVVASEGVGDITDGDVKQASTLNGIIIGFKVKSTPAAKTLITAKHVKVFQSDIIYELLESVETELSGKKKLMIAAELEILAVFDQKNNGAQIIGGKVLTGELRNQSEVEIHRKGLQVGTGKITNLQQSKKDAATVAEGLECGMLFSSSILVVKGDHLIARPL